MICGNCTTTVKEGATFCGNCGTPQEPQDLATGNVAGRASTQTTLRGALSLGRLPSKNWSKSEWLDFANNPALGLATVFVMCIGVFMPWFQLTQVSSGDNGLTYTWGVVILAIGFILAASYIFEILTSPSDHLRFRISFVFAILEIIAIIGSCVAIAETSGDIRDHFGGGARVGSGLYVTLIFAILGFIVASAQTYAVWKTGGATMNVIKTSTRESTATRNAQSSESTAPQFAGSIAEELSRFGDLRDRGVLSEQEFQAQKNRLLGL